MPIKEREPGTWSGVAEVAMKLDFAENGRKEMAVVDHKTVNVCVSKYYGWHTPGFCRNPEHGVHDVQSGKQGSQADWSGEMEVIKG